MATQTVVADRRYDTVPRDAATSGGLLVTYALALIFLWFGCLKFTQYEAAGIAPLIMNSPVMVWLHGVFGIAGASRFIGVYEILTGLLLAARLVNPRLAAVGGAMATLCFLATVSFLFTTPGSSSLGSTTRSRCRPSRDSSWSRMSSLLAVSLAVLLGARAEAGSR